MKSLANTNHFTKHASVEDQSELIMTISNSDYCLKVKTITEINFMGLITYWLLQYKCLDQFTIRRPHLQ